MKVKTLFFNGIVKENPILVLLLGLCPALGTSTSVINALGMGSGVIFVLLGSNLFVSLLKNFIPDQIRIPCYIVIIASFVTMVKMVMEAYMPPLYESLGVFVPLIVVNCVILGRAEAFASKNSVIDSLFDALAMGLGFTLALIAIAVVREFSGNGTLFGAAVPFISANPVQIMVMPAGAMLVMGYLIALSRHLKNNAGKRKG